MQKNIFIASISIILASIFFVINDAIINYLSVIIFLFIVNNRMKSLGLEIFKKKLPSN